ncbi:MAG: hypothetical protein IKI12_06810 [Lachnospiraceae bacterium]|nr:hypothetical protein [Lachnospiraceae bacterium]
MNYKTRFINKKFWYGAASFLIAAGRAVSLKFYGATTASFPGKLNAVIVLLRTLVYTAVFFAVLCGADRLLDNRKITSRLFVRDGEKKGTWWEGYAALAAGWLPLLLIKYPAALCWDSWSMIYEYRNKCYTEHQSVYYEVIMGRLIELGKRVGHTNWGLFAFSVLHYVILVAAFGYSLQILRKMNISRKCRWAVTLIYLLNPYIAGYVGVIIKDFPYAVFMLILFLCMVEIYLDSAAFSRNPLKLAVLFISVVNIYLIRKNGSYIVFGCAVLLAIRTLRKKLPKRPVVVMIAALAVSAAVFGMLGTHFHAVKGSVKEALSLPFQQTARYVKVYGDEVTEEEKAAIDAVLPYDELARKYKPRISDPIKNMYKEDGSKLPAYFKVWFRQFLKHPLCYVSATWEQNYYLFVPEVDNIVLYQDIDTGYELQNVVYMPERWNYSAIFGTRAGSETLKQWIIQELNLLHRIPGVRLLGNISFWFYLLLFVTVLSFVRRTDDLLLLALLYFSVLFVLLGPVIQGHPRYMFPVIYAMPVMLLFMIAGQVHGENKTPDRR